MQTLTDQLAEMKLFSIIFFFIPFFSNGQENSPQIKELENIKSQLAHKVNLLNDSIKSIDLLIESIRSKQDLRKINNKSLMGIATKGAKLRKAPLPLDEALLTLNKDREVTILDYHNGYFGVCVDTICGYMNDIWLKRSNEIDSFVEATNERRRELARIEQDRKIKQIEKEYALLEQKYIKKYGKATYEKLRKGYIWVGMTDEMAMISLGSPKDVNRSVGSWGVHEQWVYDNLYIYFENGKCTSYQD